MDLISVIMPVYNSQDSVKNSIDSVLKQEYSNFELIVIDDGSTDNTKNIVKNINDPRIRYLYQDNFGQGIARNTGLLEARGKYIAFIDADDRYEDYYLLRSIELFNRYDVDVIEFNYSVISNKKEKRMVLYNSLEYFEKKNIVINFLKKGLKIPNSTYPVWNKIYKKEKIEGVFFSNNSYNEDYLFNFEVMSCIDTMIGINFKSYNYDRSTTSTTISPLTHKDMCLIDNAKLVFDMSEDKEKKYTEARYYHTFFSLYLKKWRYGSADLSKNDLKIILNGMNKGINILLSSCISLKRKFLLLGMYVRSIIYEKGVLNEKKL